MTVNTVLYEHQRSSKHSKINLHAISINHDIEYMSFYEKNSMSLLQGEENYSEGGDILY